MFYETFSYIYACVLTDVSVFLPMDFDQSLKVVIVMRA